MVRGYPLFAERATKLYGLKFGRARRRRGISLLHCHPPILPGRSSLCEPDGAGISRVALVSGVVFAARLWGMGADDPAELNLDVYDTRDGLWNPEHGALEIPDGWEQLPTGEAFVTRQVKAAGVFWLLWQPRGRNRPHRRSLGLLAPATTISTAQKEAEKTAERRAKQRVAGARQRERGEVRYRDEFAAAVRAWLDFTAEHAALAEEIAVGAAEQAAVVGSGRVGRTATLPLEERAALAARAYIRHRHTDYEQKLAGIDVFEIDLGDLDDLDDLEYVDYQEIKRAAQRDVDAFLDAHRHDGSALA